MRLRSILLAVVPVSAIASVAIMLGGALPDGVAVGGQAIGIVVAMTLGLSFALLMVVAGLHNCIVSKDWSAPRQSYRRFF